MLMCAAVAAGCSTSSPETEPLSFTTPTPLPQPTNPPITLPGTTPVVADDCAAFLAEFGSDRNKLAQLLTVGVTSQSDAETVVDEYQVGGIFLGTGTSESLITREALDAVQAKNTGPAPVMVTIDEEGGRVSRFPDLFTDGTGSSARSVATNMSPTEAYNYMHARAEVLAERGVTVDFAPVVDLTQQNAAIGDRSFADDAATVTEYAQQYIRALNDAGVGAVLKHFPGHGRASGDSHMGSVETPSWSELEAADLVPYTQLTDSGAAVMIGHLIVPGVTESGTPASLSPAVMSRLRNGEYSGGKPFNGVIFTDDLSGMAAITDEYSTPQAAAKALEAGADVALWISTDAVQGVLDQLEVEVQAGQLSMADVDQKVLRIARFKNAAPVGC